VKNSFLALIISLVTCVINASLVVLVHVWFFFVPFQPNQEAARAVPCIVCGTWIPSGVALLWVLYTTGGILRAYRRGWLLDREVVDRQDAVYALLGLLLALAMIPLVLWTMTNVLVF